MAESNMGPTLKRTLDGIDPGLRRVLLPWALSRPSRYFALGRLVRGYRKAARARANALGKGLVVPPFMIVSITSKCNLDCAGCYAASSGIRSEGRKGRGLGLSVWKRIISEACGVGVYSFILAGGEPFMYPGLLEVVGEFRDRVFIIVTNGTAISAEDMERLGKLTNVVVVVSIEGGHELTDARRGDGVYKKAMDTLKKLGELDVVTGISVTVSRLNCAYWMDGRNLDALEKLGIKLGVFIEYIPSTPVHDASCTADLSSSLCPSAGQLKELYEAGDDALALAPAARKALRRAMLDLRARRKLYIIHSPGDEEYFGGCVSAGRGFAHITPSGDLTPCPVSDIATHNVAGGSVREALASPLFSRIREDGSLLESGDSTCALAAHPEEVERLAREVGAHHAGRTAPNQGSAGTPLKRRKGPPSRK
jgi:MoaA/NifB/PqqE/SkfB family radical SAM enzyme